MDIPPQANKLPPTHKGGFTLIELLVAISILLVLSTAMLANYNSMNTRLTLDTLAHQTAQWVRETQVLAMSVKQTTGGANAFPGYGLHFDRATPTQFIFFADFDGDKNYTPIPGGKACSDAGVECQKIITLRQGNTISKLCMASALSTGAALDCGAYLSASIVDIIFTRPDPDALIRAVDSINATIDVSNARITITTPTNYSRTVEVWTTGQVSVQ